jgi:hypothetical protein
LDNSLVQNRAVPNLKNASDRLHPNHVTTSDHASAPLLDLGRHSIERNALDLGRHSIELKHALRF